MRTQTTVDTVENLSAADNATTQTPRSAPVELDPHALRLVAGGLPRATWGADGVTYQTDLPRATW